MVDARSRLFKVYSRRQDCNTNKATSVRPPPPPTPAPQELKEASRNREATGIELIPDERNVYLWTALIKVGGGSAHPPAGCKCAERERLVYCWHCRASFSAKQGPKDTPFEGGTFELAITVPEQYPLVAPAGVLVRLWNALLPRPMSQQYAQLSGRRKEPARGVRLG